MRRCVWGSNAPHRKYISPLGSAHTKLNVLWVTRAVLLQPAGGYRVRLPHAAGTHRILLLPAGYTFGSRRYFLLTHYHQAPRRTRSLISEYQSRVPQAGRREATADPPLMTPVYRTRCGSRVPASY